MKLRQKPTDALALIEVAAQAPSLDELARRARQVLAMQEPSEADLKDLCVYWRAQRASWGARKEEKADADAD